MKKLIDALFGGYEISRTNNKIKLTILASGSEVNLAIANKS